MIDLSKYLIFENNKKTFKETSKDDHDGSITYMTESQYQVISFDDVKEEYIKDLGLKSVPRSNDALLSLPDGSLVFVEFPPFAIEYLLSVRWRKPAENICIARSSSSLCTRYLHNQQSSALILL